MVEKDDMDWELSNQDEWGDDDMVVDSQPEIKKMTLDDVRPTVNKRIEDMQDLFVMDKDSLIKIARHYRWNNEAMSTQWFEQ